MGFGSVISTIRDGVLSTSLGFAGDFAPVIALVVGIGAFGMALMIIRKFVS